MKRKLRTVLLVLLALVFAGSAAIVGYKLMQQRANRESYDAAKEVAGLPQATGTPASPAETEGPAEETEPPAPEETGRLPEYRDAVTEELLQVDLAALQAVNSEVLGWIQIPDTVISYPLLQGEDNQYYLTHTWEKKYNEAGSIFVECQNEGDLSGFSTIIYGHRMSDRSMFGPIRSYSDQEFWAAHPLIYIVEGLGCYTYEIYAAYEAGVKELTYRLGFPDQQSRQEYIDFGLERSVIDTGVIPSAEGRVLTLSTCTGQGHATRWVVQAALKGIDTGTSE